MGLVELILQIAKAHKYGCPISSLNATLILVQLQAGSTSEARRCLGQRLPDATAALQGSTDTERKSRRDASCLGVGNQGEAGGPQAG